MNINQYFKFIEEKTRGVYEVAEKAKAKGYDPENKVEIPLAMSLAERAAGLISIKYPQLNNPKLIKRIGELEKEFGKLDPAVCLTIAEEIAKEKFCKFRDLLEAIDAGIRLGFAYYTLGVVVPPLEGFTHYELKKTRDGKDYFAAFFSGPIRAAGTTAGAFSLVIIDYLRKKFGYAKWDPDETEIKRYIIETHDYHERGANLQYLPKDEELRFLLEHFPFQVDGLPTEKLEVSNYKDLERIETNKIRGGMCLVFAESLAQKAEKLLRFVKKLREQGFDLDDWDFLEEFVELKHKLEEKGKEESSTATYIKDIVAGRPVFAHPSKSGAFRLRYGRSRVSGFSAMAVHPATMGITNGFLAFGTQIKTEKPTKGAALGVCDSIDGPIVKLENGSVRLIKTKDEALKIYPEVKEIIYLGDILVPYADFLNRNAQLEVPGYVEQYWNVQLKKKSNLKLNPLDISFDQSVELSNKYQIPLHPKYIYYWSQLSNERFLAMLDWVARGNFNRKLILPYSKSDQERFKEGKRALEILGVEHEVTIENVVLNENDSRALLVNLGVDINKDLEREINRISEVIKNKKSSVLDLINELSSFIIKDKAGTWIGARMGRPEKAKLRKLVGSPHVLFPIGDEGGRLRSVQEACEVGTVRAEWPLYYCEKCKKDSVFSKCVSCEEATSKMYYCSECKKSFMSKCEEHDIGISYSRRKINIKDYMDAAVSKLNLKRVEVPVLVKGVRGTSSENHIVENLSKGILRANFNLNVNKDGTIRYDVTEMPITHFRPKEIGTSVEKLREIGYILDADGKELVNDNQILELFPHDVILPACPDSPDDGADNVFMNITKFMDVLLKDFYGVESFYNVKKPEDLVGHLVACIAPHNAAGVIGRIIGFSKTQAMLASPYMHAGMRRDADGDEAAFILLLDALVNFSRHYLPSHRGATQDAPLVLNAKLNPGEVDDQIFDFDVMRELPLELYEAAEQKKHSSEVREFVELIKDRVVNEEPAFKDIWYDYETTDINGGVLCSSYKSLPTMADKVAKMMELVEKIRAANTGDVARLIIDRHFIRDIRGNLRKFATQQFRCVKCNEKYRRPPLSGVCKCGGKIIFTISHGSIIKYLEPALELAANYDVPAYIKQNLDLTKMYIESIFGREKEKQESIQKWF
ncbi:MAG: DNA polymerase II large subunit [Nanoarchaeota archaeon]|nr:DNA polymerase II large subunit [Nanoarchaeota archaeon]